MGYCCVSFQTRHGNLRPDKSWWVPTNLSCHLSDPIPHSHLHVRKAPTGRAIYFQLLAAKDRLKCWFLLLSTAQTKNIGQNCLNTIFHGNEPPFPVSYPLTAILVGFLWFFSNLWPWPPRRRWDLRLHNPLDPGWWCPTAPGHCMYTLGDVASNEQTCQRNKHIWGILKNRIINPHHTLSTISCDRNMIEFS